MDKIYLYINETATYDLGQLVIDGYEEPDSEAIPASVADLRLQITAQKRLLDLKLHSDEKVVPWGMNGEVLVTHEGMFRWDENTTDYVRI